MTHRERAMAALNHRQPDRVPVDLGATRATSIVLGGYEKLKALLGVEGENRITSTMMQIVDVDEKILNIFDTDFRPLYMSSPDKGRDEFTSENSYVDEWGVERVRFEGGIYYDQTKYPLSGDISIRDITRYPWPDPHDKGRIRGLKDRAKKMRQGSEHAVVLCLPPAFIHPSQYLRGFEDWYVDIAINQELACALFDTILEINMETCRQVLDAVGSDIDVVYTSDDLGMQDNLCMPAETYRKLIKPRHKKYFSLLHEKTDAKVFLHTCGAVAPIVGDLIEIGVDILNPVQVSARGMDPAHLKRAFGKDIAFWGAIDTHRLLPHGTVEEVGRGVERMIDILGGDGGFVVAPVHNIQPDVPAENVAAMYRHAVSYRPSR